jgi:tetratricopeptide (TPR) repeat protein
MIAKILIFVLFVFASNIYAQKVDPDKTDVGQKYKERRTDDELLAHLSAAETYQISGDLLNAAAENRAVIGIALQRAGNIAVEEGNYVNAIDLLSVSLAFADNAPNRINLAVAYQRSNQLDKALAEAMNAVAKDPKYSPAHYILGNIYFTKQDYRSALPELETVIQSTPDFDVAQALGLTYLYLKQLDRAKLLFDELRISAGKERADLHLLFARAFEKTTYPMEAERELKRALAINPKQPKANFYLGYLILQQAGAERLPDAAAAFEEELKLTPNDFYCNFFIGVVASAVNDHPKAIKYFQKAIQIDDRHGEAFLFLGQSQIETNDLVAAEKSLRQAVVLEGGKPEWDIQSRRTHFMLGRLLVRTGRKEEGERELKLSRELQEKSIQSAREEISQILGGVVGDTGNKAGNADKAVSAKIELSPARVAELNRSKAYLADLLAQAYHNLGVIAVQNGANQDALSDFASAAAWKPTLAGLDRNWGIVSFRAGQFDKAIAPLARHLKSNPQDKLVRQMLGASYYFVKDFDNAVLTLKAIEPVSAGDAELEYFYGISLVQLKRNQEAVPVFTKLAELYHKDPEALFYAAQGFMILGDFARAVQEFRTVVALKPDSAKANYFIGQCLIRLNKYDEAEKAFSRELELDPTDVLSKYHLALTLIERKIEVDKTIKILQEAIGLKYDYADARYQLGKIYLEKGETTKAIEQFEIAVSADGGKDYIHYQMSIAYRKASRKDDADRELKRYQELKTANRKTGSPM